MPEFEEPNTDPGGGDLGSQTSSSSSSSTSLLKPGSPSNRMLLSLIQSTFFEQLNNHGFPQFEADYFQIGNLHLTSSLFWESEVTLSSPSSGLLSLAASGIQVHPAICGRATLASGLATVFTPGVSNASNIFLTIQSPAGTVGTPYVSSRSPGQFTISSSSGYDSSVVAWLILEVIT